MIKFKKCCVLITLFFTSLFSLSAIAQTKLVPAFIGGIDISSSKICQQQIKQSTCQLKNLFTDHQQCVKSILVKYPACKQALAFFNLTDGGVIDRIRSYQNIDVILANYVYIADQGTGYFLVMENGQYMSLPLGIPHKTLSTAPGYAAIAKRYPHIDAWQIMDFPTAQSIADKRYRLVFTQELKDGCNACAIAGHAHVAYDFTQDGKQFLGISVLKLVPK